MAVSPIYKLYNAITLNATGKKENVLAAPIKMAEIRRHQHQFQFDFALVSRKFVIYKVHLERQSDIIQGMVAFRYQKDYLDCQIWKLMDSTSMEYPFILAWASVWWLFVVKFQKIMARKDIFHSKQKIG